MAQSRLSETVLRETARLVGEHKTLSAASLASGIPRETLRARYHRLRQDGQMLGIPVPPLLPRVDAHTEPSVAERRALPASADSYWLALDEAIGRTERIVTPPPRRAGGRRERIAIAGDFHAPFHEPALVSKLITAERGKADVLVVNGDLQDFYAVSRFTKYEKVPVLDELAAVDALIGTLASAFPEVILVTGNHDRPRFERTLRSVLPPDLLDVITFLTGGNLDPIAAIASRYPNVSLARTAIGRHSVTWFYQRGDLVCTHAEKFSRVPGSALRAIHEWLTERAPVLGLHDWRVLVQAHTHQLGVLPWSSSHLLIEGGCMCQTHGYQLDARIAGRTQRRGYVTLEQEDGVTDVNSVRFFWWDRA